MIQTNLLKGTLKRLFSFQALFLVLFYLDFIKVSGFNSLRLLNEKAYETDNYKPLNQYDDSSNKNINFYLENIIEKKRDLFTRYLVEEDDLDNILSKIKCLWVDTESYLIYNFYSLDKIINNDTDLLIKNDTNANGGEYYFRLCGNTFKTCNNNASQLIYFNQANDNCVRMSDSFEQYNQWSLLDLKDPKSGVNITLSAGDLFSNQSSEAQHYSVHINAKCKPDANKISYFELDASKLTVSKANSSFSIVSDEACPYTFLSDFWMFLEQLKVIGKLICIAICVIGGILCFFGNKLITATIFIVSSIFSVLVFYNLIFNLIGVEGSKVLNSFIVLIALGIGIGLGFLITKKKKVWLSFIFGVLSAVIVDLILFLLILGHINLPKVIYLILIPLSIIACIVFFYKYLTILFIIMTTFNGSYLSIRSLSISIGGFPSEFYIIYLVFVGEYASVYSYLTWKAYLYLLSWICLMSLGIFVQNKMRPEKDQFEDEFEKDGISLKKKDYAEIDRNDNYNIKNKESLL